MAATTSLNPHSLSPRLSDFASITAYLKAEKIREFALAETALGQLLANHQGRRNCTNFDKYFFANHCAKRDLPWFVILAVINDCLAPEYLPQAITQAWSRPEFPESALGRKEWVGLFRLAGFSQDGVAAPAPTANLTLYRGATTSKRRGLSWTDDLEQAQWFADRFKFLDPAFVYSAEVAPERLLAHVESRGESEWVIDPQRLTLAELEASIATTNLSLL